MTLRLPPTLDGHEIVVLDVEGNGGQPPEIIELAMLPLTTERAATTADLRSWLIRPAHPIDPIVTRKVHGITDADVADSPPWTEVVDEITAAITGRVLVAHNASVERRVLGAHLPDWQPPLVLDTLRLAKTVWPDLTGGYGLDRLIAHADLTPPPAATPQRAPDRSSGLRRRHRAGYDTWMTAALLIALLRDLLGDREVDGDPGWTRLTAAAAVPGPRRTRPLASAADSDLKEGGLW